MERRKEGKDKGMSREKRFCLAACSLVTLRQISRPTGSASTVSVGQLIQFRKLGARRWQGASLQGRTDSTRTEIHVMQGNRVFGHRASASAWALGGAKKGHRRDVSSPSSSKDGHGHDAEGSRPFCMHGRCLAIAASLPEKLRPTLHTGSSAPTGLIAWTSRAQ